MKRTLCLFLALILAVGICFSAPVTITASAEGGTFGDGMVWSIERGTLYINGTGPMVDYVSEKDRPWYSYRYDIKNIFIYDGVTTIGENAFYNCISLLEVTIPNSVTTIGKNAFCSCRSLTTITIPNNVTTIGEGAFSGCTDLTEITIPNSVKTIGNNVFRSCSSLTTITIPNSVTTIGEGAFSGCTDLTEITIPNSVKTIGNNAFKGCSSLTTITIPNRVKTIGNNAFNGCKSLTTITIPNSVTTIGEGAFSKCTALSEITIPNSVTTIYGKTFSGCTDLSEVTIPDSVTTIYGEAFSGCTALTEITIPHSVETIYGSAFSKCTSLTSIKVDEDNEYLSDDEGVVFNKNKTTLIVHPIGKMVESYTIPDSVTRVGSYAFSGCTSLKEVIIPDSVTTVYENAFSNCTSLLEVTIPDSVTYIGNYVFSACTKLASITIPDSVTIIGINAFYGCTSLKSVIIPGSVTKIDVSTFNGCKSLESVVIHNGVTEIKKPAFSGCTSLITITIPESVTTIDSSVFSECTALKTVNVPCSWDENPKYETFGDGVLNIAPHSNYANGKCGACSKICSPHMTTGESNICTVCGAAVGNCGASTNDGGESSVTWLYDTNTKTLMISGSGDMADYSEGTEPWSEYKTEITNIAISEGVTKIDEVLFGASYSSLESINVDANNTKYSSENGVLFNSDKTMLIRYPSGKAVESYAIPSTVTVIGTAAFKGCNSLTTITIPKSVETIETSAFSEISSGATVNVPCGWDENNPLFTFDDDIKVKIAPHDFKNSVCINCGYKCPQHKYVAGKCEYCSLPCTHGTTEDRANCSVCGCVKAGDFTLSFTNGGDDRCAYDDQTGVLTVKDGAEVTISNTNPDAPTTNTIFVAYGASANITLAGVNIDVSATKDACAFKIRDDSAGNVIITLADGTENYFKSGENCAGLQKNCSGDTTIGKLTIQGEQYGTGCLTAQGGTNGAGIGGGYSGEGSEITITGGTVTAQGGINGAGIGGGCSGDGSEITITGGTVTAKGGFDGAGIGGGFYGIGSEITISGGTVTAQGGDRGAGIGGGYSGEGSEITISGGSVKAVAGSGANNIGGGERKESVIPTDGSGNNVYLMIIENENVAPIKINNEAITPIKHGTENRVYIYLKADDYTVKVGNNELDYRFFEAINRIIVKNNYNLDFTISGGKVDEDYVGYEDTLYILKDTPLTIANKRDVTVTNDKIVVAKDVSANITLAGVYIDVLGISNTCAFKIEDNSAGNVTITLADGSENCFKSGDNCAGLQKNCSGDTTIGKLIIQGEHYGTGCLTARGGTNGAGIGGGNYGKGSKITISGGIITAYNGGYGAGIGGGDHGAGSEITISGGTITATGGESGAGIGGGYYGAGSEITISGGTVKAQGGKYGAGIGGGLNGTGSEIKISGGTVKAQGGDRGAGIGGGNDASGSKITISEGTITATGGTDGAGIGGGYSGEGSEISISGGTITATGGTDGAGIGGGFKGTGSKINISGGTVTVKGGSSGAGIGGGLNGTGSEINISGGTITAQGGRYGAGVGGGDNASGSEIYISGGSVKAVAGTDANEFGGGKDEESVIPTDGSGNNVYLFELAVDGTSEVAINSNTNYPKKHFTEDKLYIYLPAKTAQSPNVVEVGEMTTKYTYDTTGSKWLTVVDVLTDDIVFTYDGEKHNIPESSYYTISGDNQTNAGTYTVKVKLNDKENTVWSDNTTDDKDCSFTIKKAQPTVTAPEAKTLTYTGSAEALVTEGTVVGGTLQYSLNGTTYSTEIPSGTNAGEYAVWYKVIGDDNHNNTDPICITVNIAKATPVITEVAGTAITYGNTLNASTLSGSAHYSNTDNTVVEGSFSWKDTNVKPTVSDSNNTSYTVVFTPTDTTNYNTAEATTTLTVNKAENAPYMPGNTMSVPYSSKTVSAVTLPTDWVWQDADKNITLEVEKTTNVTAIYTGADKGNYENESVTVAITRSKCEHSETELRNAKAATCTEGGYTGDTYCLICNITTVMGNEIKAKGHTEVIVTGKAPTHTETGLTDGKVCSVCDTIIVAQQVIPCLIPGEIKAEDAESNSFSATVVDINSIVTKLQLTEEEKALIEQGADMKIVFKLSDIGATINTPEKEAIFKALTNEKIAVFLDIQLVKQIANNSVNVQKLNGLIKVTVELPSEFISKDGNVKRSYSVLRYHDGDETKVTTLNAKFDEATGTLTFETDRFSTYAIVYSDVVVSDGEGVPGTPDPGDGEVSTPENPKDEATPGTPETPKDNVSNDKNDTSKDDVPKAGVISTTSIWLGAMALSGLGALLVSKKKKED